MEKKKGGHSVSIWIHQDLLDRVDFLAQKSGITRNKMITNMVEVATDTLTKADAVGIVSISLFIRDVQEQIMSLIRDSESKQESEA